MGLFNHKRDETPAASNPFAGYGAADDTATATTSTTDDATTVATEDDTPTSYLDGLDTNTDTPAANDAPAVDSDKSINDLLNGLVKEQETPVAEESIDSVVPAPALIEDKPEVKETEPEEKAEEKLENKVQINNRKVVNAPEQKVEEKKPEVKPVKNDYKAPERKPIVVNTDEHHEEKKETPKPAIVRNNNSDSRVAEFDTLLSWIESDTSAKTSDVQEIIRGLENRINDIRDALAEDTEGLSDEAKALFEKNTDKNIELINDQISKERKTQTAFDNRKHQFVSTITKALESYRRPVKSEEIESAVEHKDNGNNENGKK